MKRLEDEGRFACRPRWALVDVLSMQAGYCTFFDEVKTDQVNPYANFKPLRRNAFLELAARAGAQARLIWWPTYGRKDDPGPVILLPHEWPT